MVYKDLPGVRIKTIDLSEALLPVTGPQFLYIGPADAGPVYEPTEINSSADFIRTFGLPYTDASLQAYTQLNLGQRPIVFVRTYQPDLVELAEDDEGTYYIPKSQIVPSIKGETVAFDVDPSTPSPKNILYTESLANFVNLYSQPVDGVPQSFDVLIDRDTFKVGFLSYLGREDKWTDPVAQGSEASEKSFGTAQACTITLKGDKRTSFNLLGAPCKDIYASILLDLGTIFAKEGATRAQTELTIDESGTRAVIHDVINTYFVVSFNPYGYLTDEITEIKWLADYGRGLVQDYGGRQYFSTRSRYYKYSSTLTGATDPLQLFKTYVIPAKAIFTTLVEKGETNKGISVSLNIYSDPTEINLKTLPFDFTGNTVEFKEGDALKIFSANWEITDRTDETGAVDLTYLKNIFGAALPYRNTAFKDKNGKVPRDPGWTGTTYLDTIIPLTIAEDKIANYPNLFEILFFFIIGSSDKIWTTISDEEDVPAKSKSIFILRENNYSDLMKTLHTDDISRDSLYWGMGFDLADGEDFEAAKELWELYQGRTKDDVASVSTLVGSLNTIISDRSPIADPGQTDFWYALVPTKYFDPAVYGKVMALEEFRGEDFIYLPTVEFDTSGGDPVDIITAALEGAPESMWFGYYWPGITLDHPISGGEVDFSGAATAAILFGNLETTWQSPAGSDRGVVYFAKRVKRKINNADADTLYTDVHVNPIYRPQRGMPLMIWGNRTSYKKGSRVKSALSSINVALLVVTIRKNLRPVLLNFLFDINDPMLFTKFTGQFSPYLESLKRAGALYYYELVDGTTPGDRDLGQMKVYVVIQPGRETERIYGYIVVTSSSTKFTLT